jgi:hypothetical protein
VRTAVAIFAALVALATGAFAQTADQRQAIERAERIGRDIYEHDRAAWLGTDALREDMGDEVGPRLRGWITERDGDQVAVTFLTEEQGQLRGLYRAVLRDGALIEREAVNAPLSETQLRLYRARQAAMQSNFAPCSRTYNTVTLPNPDGSTADVYLLPGTTDPNVILVGGAYRVRVNLHDAVVQETEAFSRSCLTIPRSSEIDEQAVFFTHIATPMPTETHVFLNLSLGLPVGVATREAAWLIVNGNINLVEAAGQ